MCMGSMMGGWLGGFQQARAESQAIAYNRSVLLINKAISELKAEDALRKGETRALSKGLKLRALYGTQKAEYGASGVEATRGTPLRAMMETKKAGSLDMMTIRYNAFKEYQMHKIQAYGYQQQFEMLKFPDPNLYAFTGMLGGMGGGGGGGNFFASTPQQTSSGQQRTNDQYMINV